MGEHRIKLSGGGLVARLWDGLGLPTSPAARISILIAFAVLVLWLPLVLFSAFDGSLVGTKVDQPLIRDLVPHVRLLLAVPILVVAGLFIDPRISRAAQYIEDGGIVPASDRSQYHSAEAWLASARDAVWPDVILLLLAYVVTFSLKPGYGESAFEAATTSWAWTEHGGDVSYTRAGWWYALVSGPLFQFALFRWVFRFLIWATFLFRVSCLSLDLRPAHPDLAGGIGYLGIAQQSFSIVFFALSTVLAATVAHDILLEGVTFKAARIEIVYLAAILLVALYAPLFAFTPKMVRAREGGLRDYGLLGHKLFQQFSKKWSESPKDENGKALLASTEPSTTADYSATYQNVHQMRVVPMSLRGAIRVGVVLLIPFAPLLLTQYSIDQLIERVISALA